MKIHADRAYFTKAPLIYLRLDEKDATIVERDGKYYLIIRTDERNEYVAFMNHTAFREVDDSSSH